MNKPTKTAAEPKPLWRVAQDAADEWAMETHCSKATPLHFTCWQFVVEAVLAAHKEQS